MGFLKKAVGAVSTGGLSLLGGGRIKDALFGKKDAGTPDSWIGLDPSLRRVTEKAREGQEKAAGIFGSELDKLKSDDSKRIAGDIIKEQLSQGRKSLIQQMQDQKMRAKQLVAQRGLGRSAVGLGAIMRADEPARRQLTELNRSTPLARNQLERQFQSQRLSDIGRMSGGLNSILGAQGAQRTFVQGRKGTGRSGGLLGTALSLGGGIIGKKFGVGKQGASAGSALGSTIANF